MNGFDHDRLARLGSAARDVGAPRALGSDAHSRSPRAIAGSAGTSRSRALVPAVWLGVRGLGGLALLAVGAVHLDQYLGLYSAIPTIGTLFVLNFAGATALGLGVLSPIERVLGRRRGGAVVGLLALSGIALAITSFVFLAVSEHTPLFGFMEPGYDPTAILASRVGEVATVVLLGSFLAARFGVRARVGRW
jgi:hypothetical protein